MYDIFDHYNCFVLNAVCAFFFFFCHVTNLNLASVNLLCTLFNLLCTLYCIYTLRYLACLFLVYPFREKEDDFT